MVLLLARKLERLAMTNETLHEATLPPLLRSPLDRVNTCCSSRHTDPDSHRVRQKLSTRAPTGVVETAQAFECDRDPLLSRSLTSPSRRARARCRPPQPPDPTPSRTGRGSVGAPDRHLCWLKRVGRSRRRAPEPRWTRWLLSVVCPRCEKSSLLRSRSGLYRPYRPFLYPFLSR